MKEIEIPDWQKKLDALSRRQLRSWQNGRERPPQMLNGFVNFDTAVVENRHKVEALGVLLYTMIGDINTADIPWHHLQDVCELGFIKSVSFSKQLRNPGVKDCDPTLKRGYTPTPPTYFP